ncbi:MAG: D-2-hydroxyacid dehydrogenase [Pseudomonadota bacterium]
MAERPRILLHNAQTQAMAASLQSARSDVDFRTCERYDTLPQLLESYRPDIVYTVRFAGSPGYPRDALLGPSGPRWIANGGAGTDHLGHWDTSRVTITNAAGIAADMMAEYIMGAFLHFTLDVPGLLHDKSARRWQSRLVRPLAGQSLLIVGLGHTGRALAARAKAFGMHILGTRANPRPMAEVDEVHAAQALPDLLPRADFIAVCTPLTKATHRLIGPEEVAAMKQGTILADVSRGGVIDQKALYGALKNAHIAGAALDVFETEPLPADSPFWDLDNTLISPHCSSVSEDWETASFDLFLQNLGRWMAGEPLRNIVDPDRGY